MLRPFAHPVACCWMWLRVKARSLKPVNRFSQQLPTVLLFRDRRSVAQQCWIRLHSSSNIVGAAHAHCLQWRMGCILPTMHCRSWELLHPFAHHCQHARNNSQHCWRFARSLRTHLVTYFLRPSLCPVTLFFAVYLLFWCLYCNLVKLVLT